MARTVLPRQWSVPNQLADFARRITSLEKLVGTLAPRSAVLQSGEVLVPILNSDFRTYTSGSEPTVVRVGNTVEFWGSLGSDNIMTGSTIAGVMTIPAGFRPKGFYSRVYVCQGSGANRWALTVRGSDGRLDVGRYGPGSSAANTWMPFAVTWTTSDPWPS